MHGHFSDGGLTCCDVSISSTQQSECGLAVQWGKREATGRGMHLAHAQRHLLNTVIPLHIPGTWLATAARM